MGLINEETIKIITAQGVKIYRKLAQPKPTVSVTAVFEELPQKIAGDIAEISRRGAKAILTAGDMTKIREMRKIGLSQAEIAEELGVSRMTLQRFMYKYMPTETSNRSGILSALREYFSAKSQEAKDKAFVTIDKYIEKMAKEKIAENPKLSYEDCLQNLRLQFFELERAGLKEGCVDAKSFLRAFLDKQKFKKREIEAVSIDSLGNSAKYITTSDIAIEKFEIDDLTDFIFETGKFSKWYGSKYMNNRLHRMLIAYLKDGKSVSEIADEYNLSKQQTQSLIQKAVKNFRNNRANIAFSGENYQQRIKVYQEMVKKFENGD